MTPGPDLHALIREVHQDAADAAPLTRLQVAAAMSSAVSETADALLGHFVDQSRHAGHSWAEIGEALGVSKQAAQQGQVARSNAAGALAFQRFTDLSRFTDRARSVVALSELAARDLQHSFVGTEHLLLAQFSVPEGLAARILTEAGMSKQAVREAIVAASGLGSGPADGRAAFTPKAMEAMTGALAVAIQMGHNDIGTEHLLLGSFRAEGGLAVTILEAAGLTEEAARAKVVAKLAGLQVPSPKTG